jgi:DNA-directed RNA polymerase specialized sigma24 family protein
MQPPTESTAAGPRGALDELYRRHHRDLQRAVAGAVKAPSELIEDACQTAWAIMLRTQPQCDNVFGWLRVVAIHEAYRLLTIRRREATAHSPRTPDDDPCTLAIEPHTVDDAIEALEALRTLASLPQRQRQDLTLHTAGYTYEEIRARTPGRTMTNVDKSLRKARSRVRHSRP